MPKLRIQSDDKTLRAEDFEIVEVQRPRDRREQSQ
jgi:hypothetical protein